MLYAGKFNGLVFQLVTDNVKFRITLLEPIGSAAMGTVDISMMQVNTDTLRRVQNNILSSGIVTRSSLHINRSFGDLDLLHQFIKSFNKSDLFKAVLDLDEYLGTTGSPAAPIEVLVANENVSKCGPISGLTYTTTGNKNTHSEMMRQNDTFNRAQFGLLQSRLKTFDELKHELDLTWYETPSGEIRKKYRLIGTDSDAQQVLTLLQSLEGGDMGVDTEFSPLYTYYKLDAHLYGMSLSWEDDQAIYIVFESNTTDSIDRDKWLPLFVEELNRLKWINVAHNAAAEIKSCWAQGHLLKIDADTRVVEFNKDPDWRHGPNDLKSLEQFHFGITPLELEDIMGGKVYAEMIPDIEPKTLMVYTCADADYVRQLYRLQKTQIDINKPTLKLDFSMPEMLSVAEYYGTAVDMHIANKLREYNLVDIHKIQTVANWYITKYAPAVQALDLLGEDATEEQINAFIQTPEFGDYMQMLLTKKGKRKGDAPIPLGLRNPDASKLLFGVFRYPVTRVNKDSGLPSANDDALEDLLVHKVKNPIHLLNDDVRSSMLGTDMEKWMDEKDKILISKRELESCKYPLAYLIKVFRKLDKKETSVFKKLAESDGYYRSRNSMVEARTARVINNVQTMDGTLRMVMVPYNYNYWYFIFDYKQIEWRIMLGLANVLWHKLVARLKQSGRVHPDKIKMLEEKKLDDLVQRLMNYYNDYHREGGGKLIGVTPGKMTKAQRSEVKAIHFAVPYDMSAYTMTTGERRKAKTPEEEQRILDKGENLLSLWREKLLPVYMFLERQRDDTFIELTQDELPDKLKGAEGRYGKVSNAFGRVRYMDLHPRALKEKEITNAMEEWGISRERAIGMLQSRLANTHMGNVRRESGNFPIQSFAREIFFMALVRLYRKMKEKGWTAKYRDYFDVLLSLFIHDECVINVHKWIHCFQMCAITQEICVMNIPGHPTYFIGAAAVSNWGEGKSDDYEISDPAQKWFAQMYIEDPDKWDEEASRIIDQKLYVMEWIRRHFVKEFTKEFLGQLEVCGWDLNTAFTDWDVYYLVGHVGMYYKPYIIVDEHADEATLEMYNSLSKETRGALTVLCLSELDDDTLLSGIKLRDWRAAADTSVWEQKADPQKFVGDKVLWRRPTLEEILAGNQLGGNNSQASEADVTSSGVAIDFSEFTDFIGMETLDASTAAMDDVKLLELEDMLEAKIDEAISSIGDDDIQAIIEDMELGSFADAGAITAAETLEQEEKERDTSVMDELLYGITLQEEALISNSVSDIMLQADDEEEEAIIRSNPEEEFVQRVLIYNHQVILNVVGVPMPQIEQALREFKNYTTDMGELIKGFELCIFRNGRIESLNLRVRSGFSIASLNKILNVKAVS